MINKISSVFNRTNLAKAAMMFYSPDESSAIQAAAYNRYRFSLRPFLDVRTPVLTNQNDSGAGPLRKRVENRTAHTIDLGVSLVPIATAILPLLQQLEDRSKLSGPSVYAQHACELIEKHIEPMIWLRYLNESIPVRTMKIFNIAAPLNASSTWPTHIHKQLRLFADKPGREPAEWAIGSTPTKPESIVLLAGSDQGVWFNLSDESDVIRLTDTLSSNKRHCRLIVGRVSHQCAPTLGKVLYERLRLHKAAYMDMLVQQPQMLEVLREIADASRATSMRTEWDADIVLDDKAASLCLIELYFDLYIAGELLKPTPKQQTLETTTQKKYFALSYFQALNETDDLLCPAKSGWFDVCNAIATNTNAFAIRKQLEKSTGRKLKLQITFDSLLDIDLSSNRLSEKAAEQLLDTLQILKSQSKAPAGHRPSGFPVCDHSTAQAIDCMPSALVNQEKYDWQPNMVATPPMDSFASLSAALMTRSSLVLSPLNPEQSVAAGSLWAFHYTAMDHIFYERPLCCRFDAGRLFQCPDGFNAFTLTSVAKECLLGLTRRFEEGRFFELLLEDLVEQGAKANSHLARIKSNVNSDLWEARENVFLVQALHRAAEFLSNGESPDGENIESIRDAIRAHYKLDSPSAHLNAASRFLDVISLLVDTQSNENGEITADTNTIAELSLLTRCLHDLDTSNADLVGTARALFPRLTLTPSKSAGSVYLRPGTQRDGYYTAQAMVSAGEKAELLHIIDRHMQIHAYLDQRPNPTGFPLF